MDQVQLDHPQSMRVMRCASSPSNAQPTKNVRCNPLALPGSIHPSSIMKDEAPSCQGSAQLPQQAQPVGPPRRIMRIDRPPGSSRSARVMRCTPPQLSGASNHLGSFKHLKEQASPGSGNAVEEVKCSPDTSKPATSTCSSSSCASEEVSAKSEILKCRNGHQSSYSLRALKTVPNYYGTCSGISNQTEQYHFIKDVAHDDNVDLSDTTLNQNHDGHISMLPDEILCMIFSYLPQLDLLKVCSKVCHRWQTVAKSSSLWQTLTFCGQDIPIQIVCGCIRLSPSLKSITLKDRLDIDIILPILHQLCKRLESVNLVRCRPSELNRKTLKAKYLYPFLRRGQLRNLNLKGTDYRSPKFYQKLSSMPNLRKLNVSCSGGVTPQILCEIAKHTSLKVLKHKWHSNSVYYGPKSMTIQLPGKIDEWSNAYSLLFRNAGENLTTLEFYAAGINDSALAGLASCKALKKLAVYNANCFGSEGMAAVGTLCELQELLIHNAKLTTTDVSEAFQTGNLSGLQCLHLNDSICTISDEVSADDCLKTIALKCCHLKHLSFTKCPSVSDTGVEAILRRCAELLSLDLNGGLAISGESFLLIPGHTPHLKLLVIEEDCPLEKNEIIKKLMEGFTMSVERLSTWKNRTTSYLL